MAELFERVGRDPSHGGRFPHEFSGGQCQRIGIARALALERELGVAYLSIAHDLSIVHHLCDRVAVMYLGKIVEMGDRHGIYEWATHPYAQSLLSAVPLPDHTQRARRSPILLVGDLPDPAHPPSGCRFRTVAEGAGPLGRS